MGHDFLHAKLVGNRRYALFRQNSDLGAENHHFFDRPQLVVSAIWMLATTPVSPGPGGTPCLCDSRTAVVFHEDLRTQVFSHCCAAGTWAHLIHDPCKVTFSTPKVQEIQLRYSNWMCPWLCEQHEKASTAAVFREPGMVDFFFPTRIHESKYSYTELLRMSIMYVYLYLITYI